MTGDLQWNWVTPIAPPSLIVAVKHIILKLFAIRRSYDSVACASANTKANGGLIISLHLLGRIQEAENGQSSMKKQSCPLCTVALSAAHIRYRNETHELRAQGVCESRIDVQGFANGRLGRAVGIRRIACICTRTHAMHTMINNFGPMAQRYAGLMSSEETAHFDDSDEAC
jgi:hypothetical protein